MREAKETKGRLAQSVTNRFLWLGGLFAIVLVCLFFCVAWPRICEKPTIRLNGEAKMTVAAGSIFRDEGATARLFREKIDDRVYVTGEVDTSAPGTYELTYSVDGRFKTYSVTRVVVVEDQTAPQLVLNGDSAVKVDEIDAYEDPGATAEDNYDGDLTEQISVKKKKTGDYTWEVTYMVADQAGNESTAVREVILRDQTAPEVTLKGKDSVTIKEREKFKDPGAKARDDRDGDLTDSVSVEGYVDIYRPGTYSVTYTATDAEGNQGQAVRTVTVERVHNNPKNAIYLTFDDGPSSDVTEEILDILAENGIQATFFICDYDKSTLPLIKRMIDEGHTVGIHGYSHDYAEIYDSTEDFMNNIYTLRDKLKEDTGYEAFCIRFPGGSGNSVSAEYTDGIMTDLVQMVTDDNLMYVDWNVSSGDAEGQHVPSEEILENVTSELQKDQTNIVLMHDTSAKKVDG
ncbi:MAG: DUF5011 domain-containing protein [Clostridiales bacterium]|nr:DUF5011 domain-containing protein [Clostridiales bacterium]